MALIKTIDTGLYRIPLTVSLSDSTHGEINAFELITCRVRDSDGAEGGRGDVFVSLRVKRDVER